MPLQAFSICEYFYDHNNGEIKQSVLALYGRLPAYSRLSAPKQSVVDDATNRKKKGKFKEGENSHEQKDDSSSNRLATLDIFAGCGGVYEGLQQAGVTLKWAIEYKELAG